MNFIKLDVFEVINLGTCDLSPKATINMSDRQGGLHNKKQINDYLPTIAQQQEIEMTHMPCALCVHSADVPGFIINLQRSNPAVTINCQWETKRKLFNYSTSATNSSIPASQLFNVLATIDVLRYVKVTRVGQNEPLDEENTRDLNQMTNEFQNLSTIHKSIFKCDLAIEFVIRHHFGEIAIPMVAMKNNSRRKAAQQGVVRWGKCRRYAHKCGYLSYESMGVFMGVTVQAHNSTVDHHHDWLPSLGRAAKLESTLKLSTQQEISPTSSLVLL